MRLLQKFQQFDPVTGVVPRRPFPYLGEIALRARSVLRSRTTAQIDSAASDLDWIIDEYFREAKDDEIYQLRSERGADFHLTPEMEDDLEIATAAKVGVVNGREASTWIGWYDVGGSDFQRAELFAVLSISLLAEAIRVLIATRSK